MKLKKIVFQRTNKNQIEWNETRKRTKSKYFRLNFILRGIFFPHFYFCTIFFFCLLLLDFVQDAFLVVSCGGAFEKKAILLWLYHLLLRSLISNGFWTQKKKQTTQREREIERESKKENRKTEKNFQSLCGFRSYQANKEAKQSKEKSQVK